MTLPRSCPTFTTFQGKEIVFDPTPSVPPVETMTVEMRPSLGSIISRLTLPTSRPSELRTVLPTSESDPTRIEGWLPPAGGVACCASAPVSGAATSNAVPSSVAMRFIWVTLPENILRISKGGPLQPPYHAACPPHSPRRRHAHRERARRRRPVHR